MQKVEIASSATTYAYIRKTGKKLKNWTKGRLSAWYMIRSNIVIVITNNNIA